MGPVGRVRLGLRLARSQRDAGQGLFTRRAFGRATRLPR